MSEHPYHKDQPAVTAMAWRISEGGTQEFATLEAFVAVYGQRAADMLAQGVLRSALWEIGVAIAPGVLRRRRARPTLGPEAASGSGRSVMFENTRSRVE